MSFSEFLTDMFELEEERATALAELVGEGEFLKNHLQLENLLGLNNADDIVRNGVALSYGGVVFNEYFSIAREVNGRMSHEVDKSNVAAFYSIDALKNYLKGPEEEGCDFSGIEFYRFHLMNSRFDILILLLKMGNYV